MRHRRRPTALALAAVLLIAAFPVASPTSARAQDREAEVEELLRAGLAHRRAGRLHRAVQVNEEAYALERSPRAAVQLGLTLAQLERWVDAERYLLEARSQPDDDFVRRRREDIEDALRVIREHLGSIEIRGGEPGARVLLDGVDQGSLPLPPIRVVVGDHRVEAIGSTTPAQREVRIGPGAEEVIELPTSTTPTELPPSEDDPPAPPARESRGAVVAGGVTLAFAIAGLGLGLASSLTIRNLGDDPALLEARAMTLSTDDSVCDNEPVSVRVRDICNRYPTWRALQYVGYAVAGVGLVTTAVLWVLARNRRSSEGDDEARRHDWQWSIGLEPRVASLRLAGQF